jgi:hypothetical protein
MPRPVSSIEMERQRLTLVPGTPLDVARSVAASTTPCDGVRAGSNPVEQPNC